MTPGYINIREQMILNPETWEAIQLDRKTTSIAIISKYRVSHT